MGTLAFSKEKKTDIFAPMCEEGHSQDGFSVDIGAGDDVFLIDDKGWLSRIKWSERTGTEEEPFMHNGCLIAKTECEQCLEKRFSKKVYSWKLDFTFGLLRHAWRQPCVVPGIESQVQQERPRPHP